MSNQSVTSENPTDAEPIVTPLGEMLTRKGAACYLKKRWGFGSGALLAKLATGGTGPVFHKISSTESWYPVDGLDRWATAKLGEARATFKVEAA